MRRGRCRAWCSRSRATSSSRLCTPTRRQQAITNRLLLLLQALQAGSAVLSLPKPPQEGSLGLGFLGRAQEGSLGLGFLGLG